VCLPFGLRFLGLVQPLLEIDWVAFDIVLGFQPWLTTENACTFPCDYIHCPNTRPPKEELFSIPAFDAKPRGQPRQINQADYVGVYVHPTYGSAEIVAGSNSQVLYSQLHTCLSNQQELLMYYNNGNATLTNLEYEMFVGT
jgi:hypothetical protein